MVEARQGGSELDLVGLGRRGLYQLQNKKR